MRARWTILCAGLTGVTFTLIILGRSGSVLGDTSPSTAPVPNDPGDPFTPYGLGPHPISYDQQSASDRAGIDSMQEAVELGQPAPSYGAFSSAASQAAVDAQAQISARQVGLVGTSQDGVGQ